ncbi:MAG: GTPase HflX [Bacteroidales bacterium]|nr:GTPase HflX [Bacteroidales bacterium]
MSQDTKSDLRFEKAVLVGIITGTTTEEQAHEYIEELAFLVKTAGGVPLRSFLQKLVKPDKSFFVGSGKKDEIKAYIEEEAADFVVFDDELTPSQLRNLENEFKCKVLDRTLLILDIFARRAQTSYAKTQVELAQYQYLLPRLTHMWTHLSKQKGGIGMKGPGEKEIETDRRIIRDKIALLKAKLKKIDKQLLTQRKGRESLVRVALIGYTNVGKSTIMNLLSKSDVFAENKLFATLDTTVRKVVVENLPFLLSDTVGFIRKLPHDLVESFKSTLFEVMEADMLIHVVDISHSNYEEQINVVKETLSEIKADHKPVIMVFNKIDAYRFVEKEADDLTPRTKENITIEELEKMWIAQLNAPAIFISAKEKINIDKFRSLIYKKTRDMHAQKYPFNNFLY